MDDVARKKCELLLCAARLIVPHTCVLLPEPLMSDRWDDDLKEVRDTSEERSERTDLAFPRIVLFLVCKPEY